MDVHRFFRARGLRVGAGPTGAAGGLGLLLARAGDSDKREVSRLAGPTGGL